MMVETESKEKKPSVPLYEADLHRPSADAPERDLLPELRPIFKALRTQCRGIPRAVENVRHDGPHWKWIWAYERDGYTLCAIHPMQSGVDLSFPLPQRYEPRFEKAELDPAVREAVSKGATAAKVRYARLAVPDLDAAARFFQGVELKLQLMAEEGKGA
jgi:hypothetical protein